MATFRIALADTLIRLDQTSEARTELQATVSTLVLQLKQRPEIHAFHEVLALGYSKLAIALRQTGEDDQAEEAARKAEQERDVIRRSP
jgi:hypothetical protein